MEVGEGYGSSYRSWSKSRHHQNHNQQQQQQWPQTPRPKSPRQKGKGKGKKGKSPRPRKQQQGGDQSAQAQTQPVPNPNNVAVPTVASGLSWMQAAQSMAAPLPAAPTEAHPPTAVVPAEYKGLIESLKRNQSKGTLPEDVQQEMKTLQVKEEKEHTKELNQAVKGLRKARKELQESFEARAQLHSQWRTFLSLSVTQWQGFTSQFQAQEAVALRRVTDAQTALQEAKAQLASSKEIADLPTTSNADPPEHGVADVDLISDDDNVKVEDNVSKMQAGMENLTATLEQLHSAAEDIFASEQAAKQARIQSQEDVSATGIPGAAQLQPFAKPGTKRPQQGVGA